MDLFDIAIARKLAGGSGGGGGDSDFSIAHGTITLVGNTIVGIERDANNNLPVMIIDDNMRGIGAGEGIEEGVNEFVLYKGHSKGSFLASTDVTTYSGEITLDPFNAGESWYIDFDIMGDFSITIPVN